MFKDKFVVNKISLKNDLLNEFAFHVGRFKHGAHHNTVVSYDHCNEGPGILRFSEFPSSTMFGQWLLPLCEKQLSIL